MMRKIRNAKKNSWEQDIKVVVKHVEKIIYLYWQHIWLERKIIKKDYKNEIIHKVDILHNSYLKAGNILDQIMKNKK